jgi:uncharacterized protein GlcG (DUF336 family)
VVADPRFDVTEQTALAMVAVHRGQVGQRRVPTILLLYRIGSAHRPNQIVQDAAACPVKGQERFTADRRVGLPALGMPHVAHIPTGWYAEPQNDLREREMRASARRSSYVRATVSLVAAQTILAAAERKADEMGLVVAVAVVDAGGALKCCSVMDGCSPLAARMAQQKAWSAVSVGISTHALWELIKDDPPRLHGVPHLQDLIVFPGGEPIEEDGEVVGGVGVSGGHYDQDRAIAIAAIAEATQVTREGTND